MAFGFLLPKETSFFDLFDKQTAYAIQAAEHFAEMIVDYQVDEEEVNAMKEIEHLGDEVSHQIIAQLNDTFITPFDREDIHDLTKELDDIIDVLYMITKRLRVYKILSMEHNLSEFARVIVMSVKGVAEAVKGLRNMKKSGEIMKACIEVNNLENLGDKMRDDMLADLFDKYAGDPVAVIKWKDIYQDAETVLDICEDVVNVVESILVKHA